MRAAPPTPDARLAHATFAALLWSLAQPGRRAKLPAGDPAANILLALTDLEVSVYSPDPAIREGARQSGAALSAPDMADYLLFTRWDEITFDGLTEAGIGTPLAPDLSATVFLPTGTGPVQTWRLSGPGVPGTLDVEVAGVPEAFLTLRAQRCAFPLGWDAYLLQGQDVLGLPRTTRVEVL